VPHTVLSGYMLGSFQPVRGTSVLAFFERCCLLFSPPLLWGLGPGRIEYHSGWKESVDLDDMWKLLPIYFNYELACDFLSARGQLMVRYYL
jgi:hypothetical protein